MPLAVIRAADARSQEWVRDLRFYATEDVPRSRRPMRWVRRGGAGRVDRTRRGTLSETELPKREGGARWCSGVALVQSAGAGDVRRWRRLDGPLLDDHFALPGRQLRQASELKRNAGGAIGGVVRVVLVRTTALDVRGRALRGTCLRRRCQKRGYALSRQREEGGQDENTRTWTAEFAEHAGHYHKLVKETPTVTTHGWGKWIPHRYTHGPRKTLAGWERARLAAPRIYVTPCISTCASRAPRQ